ncbi:hypothetical protein L248_2800 [Schleiferilactobacillus shenzhenensis LY-73]|uniref:Transposase IS701-like DDE domain-containing protein n=2 Tax=Schleiferilactobacillus shenzhenensis TaxID=1231337 RepID=U4TKN9_9LACO|nr:hypothetical protein L248_2800 [Schleiferilactobacillus shenzhenensis LY-73]
MAFHLVHITRLTRQVNYKRRSSLSFPDVLGAILSWVKFAGRSLYRSDWPACFTKRTAYNVLEDGRINWCKLTSGFLAGLLVNAGFIFDNRANLAFILDDTIMPRPQGKKTELLANGYDHDSSQYKRSFRDLTLGLSDGKNFMPVNNLPLSSKAAKNRVGAPAQTIDCRSNAGQRRTLAMRPMNEVALILLQKAQECGLHASIVLFDSWFSSPKMFFQLRRLGMHGLGMVKRTEKVYYRFQGKLRSVKNIYDTLRREHHRKYAKYLYNVKVKAHVGTQEFPLRLIFVTDRHRHDTYLVLATTKIGLRPDQIVSLYERRWQIEGYFKTAKQYLRLTQTKIQDYDGLCGHIAIVMLTYDLLVWQKRMGMDKETLGDVFLRMEKAMPTITLITLLAGLIGAVRHLCKQYGVPRTALNNTIDNYLAGLPRRLENAPDLTGCTQFWGT